MALTNEVLVSDIMAILVGYQRDGLTNGETDTGDTAIKSYVDGAFNRIKLDIEEMGLDPDLVPDGDSARFKTSIVWLALINIQDHLMQVEGGQRYLEKRDEYSALYFSAWSSIEVRQDTDGDGTADTDARATQTASWRLG